MHGRTPGGSHLESQGEKFEPMDFNYSTEQEAYRMDVRRWLEANQPPPLNRQEKERVDDDSMWQRLMAWHKKLYHAGWAGLTWPKE